MWDFVKCEAVYGTVVDRRGKKRGRRTGEGGGGRADEGNRRLEIAAGNDEMIGLHLRVRHQDRSNQVQNSDASVKNKEFKYQKTKLSSSVSVKWKFKHRNSHVSNKIRMKHWSDWRHCMFLHGTGRRCGGRRSRKVFLGEATRSRGALSQALNPRELV